MRVFQISSGLCFWLHLTRQSITFWFLSVIMVFIFSVLINAADVIQFVKLLRKWTGHCRSVDSYITLNEAWKHPSIQCFEPPTMLLYPIVQLPRRKQLLNGYHGKVWPVYNIKLWRCWTEQRKRIKDEESISNSIIVYVFCAGGIKVDSWSGNWLVLLTQIFICHHHLSSFVCLFPFQRLLMQLVSLISALWVGVGALISVSLLCHQTCEVSFRLPFRCAAAGYSLLNTCVVALWLC